MRALDTTTHPFSQAGWTAVDYAALRARGQLNDVIKQMQSVLDTDPVVEFCKALGISSTGFLFFDFFNKETRFLIPVGDEQKVDSYSSPYLWERTDIPTKEWSDLVHWLFLVVRIKQIENQDRNIVRSEDYFVNLPVAGDNDFSLSISDKNLRQTYGIHYCSAGEMVYTIFLWRALSVAQDNGWGRKPVNEAIVSLELESVRGSTLTWRGHNLFVEDCDESHRLQQMWGKTIGPVGRWADEWKSLIGYSSSIGTFNYSPLSAVCTFVHDAKILDQNIYPNPDDHASLNSILQKSAPEFLRRLGANSDLGSVASCLAALETHARFPILPFYVWNTLDRATKCYSVIPTWTSQNCSLTTPSGDCPHLGLALTATQPLSRIDQTIKADWAESKSQPAISSDVDPRLIINFLRLTSRPLVEGHLYYPLLRTVVNQVAEVGTAVMKGGADYANEIGKQS